MDLKDSLILNNKGFALLQEGKPKKALKCFQQALCVDLENVVILNNLGNAYARMKRYKKAIDQYQKAIQLSPDYEKAYLNMGIAFQLLEKPEEAINAYQEYLRRVPGDINARYNLGLIYKEMGMEPEASEAFRAASPAVDESLDRLIQQAASHLFINELDLAIDRCNQALLKDPESIMARYYLGFAHVKQGKLKKAVKDLEWVEARQPDFIQAISNLAVIYNTLKQHQRAIDLLRMLLQSDPDNSSLHFNLGMACMDSGLIEDAQREFLQVIKIEPENSERCKRAKKAIAESKRKLRDRIKSQR